MKYKEVFSAKFINNFNHVFNKNILDPEKDFGQYLQIESILNKIGFTIKLDDEIKTELGTIDYKNKIIYVSKHLKENDYNKYRFELAHLLGHLVQHYESLQKNIN